MPLKRPNTQQAPRKPRTAATAFDRVLPREEDAIVTLVGVITAGQWKTGVSVAQYSRTWGCSEQKVREWYRAACANVKILIDPTYLTLAFNESMEHMLTMMHELKSVDDRGSIAAGKSVLDVCVALLKSNKSDDGMSERERFRQMLADGWVPPRSLPGLPAPEIEPEPVESEEQKETEQ